MPAKKTTTTKKTVKKAPVRRTAEKKETAVVKEKSKTTSTAIAKKTSRTSEYVQKVKTIRPRYYVAAVIIIILALAAYFGWSYIFAAEVNGQFIPRYKVVNDLEKAYGSNALDQEIDNTLMRQEANRRHITVSDAEVDKQLDTAKNALAQQGATLDQYLASQGLSMNDVKDTIRLQLTETKMLGDASVSNAEINSYIKDNNITVPSDASSAAQLKNSIKSQIQQQKLQTKYQNLVTNLRQKAHIKTFVNYPPAQAPGM
jgi:hypothetical protein